MQKRVLTIKTPVLKLVDEPLSTMSEEDTL